MIVGELQTLLSNLSKFMKAGAEVAYLCNKLELVKDQKIKAFADSLDKSATPVKVPSRKKASAQDAEAAYQEALRLYNNATDPAVSVEQIETAVKALDGLAATRLYALYQAMGFNQKFKAKADQVKAIREKIMGRKGAFDRVNA